MKLRPSWLRMPHPRRLSLDQYTGQETAAIGAVYDGDIELNFTLDQAEQLGNILLQLARTGRKAACRAA